MKAPMKRYFFVIAILCYSNISTATETPYLTNLEELDDICFYSVCIKNFKVDKSDMNEITNKADRLRKTDPYSIYNSDDSSKGFGLSYEIFSWE